MATSLVISNKETETDSGNFKRILYPQSTMTHPRVRVYIVRHGETAENRSGILQGQLDTELNEQGLDQARLAGDALKDVPFSFAITSDLKRAKATAQSILKHHPAATLQEDAALRERSMGKFQGSRITKEVKIGIATDSSVESRQLFAERAMKWWTDVLLPLAESVITEPSAPSPSTTVNILVVSHGGLITTLLHELLDERSCDLEQL
ncbi:histidine phosphatase superfamily, partial [Coprinopsis sp. MPI-PUGE-AT-0042]